MRIRSGAIYETRDGKRTDQLKFDTSRGGRWPYHGRVKGKFMMWRWDGRWIDPLIDSPNDLVKELAGP